MNFYIPELKDQIKLTSDWSFDLYAEYRNETIGKALSLIKEQYNGFFGHWKIYDDRPELNNWMSGMEQFIKDLTTNIEFDIPEDLKDSIDSALKSVNKWTSKLYPNWLSKWDK